MRKNFVVTQVYGTPNGTGHGLPPNEPTRCINAFWHQNVLTPKGSVTGFVVFSQNGAIREPVSTDHLYPEKGKSWTPVVKGDFVLVTCHDKVNGFTSRGFLVTDLSHTNARLTPCYFAFAMVLRKPIPPVKYHYAFADVPYYQKALPCTAGFLV